MTNLNIGQLTARLSELSEARLKTQPARIEALARARQLLRAQEGSWEDQHQKKINVPWLMATPLENPAAAHSPGARPKEITVVATDGSQIFPDHHIEPLIYLLNIGQIVFQYGTLEPPVLSTHTQVYWDSWESRVEPSANSDLVSAKRDQLELEHLLDLASEHRKHERPVIAFADGTLIRWMLQRIDPASLKDELIGKYTDRLAQFGVNGVPICSFISMPNNTEVVNLLRGLNGETGEVGPDSLAGIRDRELFEPFLKPWQRTAVFASDSHVLREYEENDSICFFYLRTVLRGGVSEIARVEVPRWVADHPQTLGLVHATVRSECEKGDGYPISMSEAHERAVIRAGDKRLFYTLVEREMAKYNLFCRSSSKRSAKQRPII